MNLKEQVPFFLYCLKKRNDSRFIKSVYRLGDKSSCVDLEKGGDEPTDKVVYHIAQGATHSGFFADYNRMLDLLYFADYYGMIPVVEYDKECSYAEEHPVNGTRNPFEYYFAQPGGISLEEAMKYSVRLCSRKENTALAGTWNNGGSYYRLSEEYIVQLGRMTEKYISLNEYTKKKIFGDIENLLGQKKCIGVHVRGTDFKQNYNRHPVRVSPQEYLEKTKHLLEKGNYDFVFLATDDTEALTLFKKSLGNKVCFYEDVIRSDGNETVMKSEVKRKNHRYLLGLEVLRDMYTLAACDGLVAGFSQVSYAARIQKSAQRERYFDIVIIDKGENSNKRYCPT